MRPTSGTEVSLVMVLLTFAAYATPALAVDRSFTEDFTTTTYEDKVNTTADWDTTAGELRLFRGFAPSLVGSCDTPDEAWGIAVAGDLAFVADCHSGLQVIDITDPANPTLVGGLDTPGTADDVVIDGDLAFVADWSSGLQVIDITDPTNPVLAGTYDTPSSALGVAVSGDLAFVTDYDYGLQVIDIADPANPTLVGTCSVSGASRGIAVSGDLAFVADGAAGLQVIDITDPRDPALVGNFDTPGTALDVVVAGDLAFVADYDHGLQVIDISDPRNPVLTGAYDELDQARGVAVSGDLAFVADSGGSLQVIDITDPANPLPAEGLQTSGAAWDVVVAGEIAFVAVGRPGVHLGLQVIAIADPVSPGLAGSYDTPGLARSIALAGDLAFVADRGSGLQVIDITDPANPAPIGSYDTPGDALDIAVAGDLAFVADHTTGMLVIDITDPTDPVLAGAYDTGYGYGIAVSGNLAFVAAYNGGLQVIDITDPTNPVLAGAYDTPGLARDVAVSGNLAFIADQDGGLQVIDVTDPTSPVLAATYDTPGSAFDVAVEGDLAFVADSNCGLQVIDITDPTSPVLAGTCDTPGGAYGIAVSGKLALVADHGSGLQVVDITDPTNPTLAGSCDTPGLAYAVAVAGDLAFIADEPGGLQVIQVYQHELDPQRNVGQSVDVCEGGDTIVRARLTTTESPIISWELSADGGASWADCVPDAPWSRFSVTGEDLRWRSRHTIQGGGNPTVYELTIDWLNEFGPIASISDVPDDQGGWVRLNLIRSGYDFADETELPVTGYWIHQRIDDAAQRSTILSTGVVPTSPLPERILPASFALECVRQCGEKTFVIGAQDATSEMPPGVWEVVGSIPAMQQDTYMARIPTGADSTAHGGIAWSVYLVTTHTTTPSIWFACPPDSGYSVDNIAPGVPGNLVFGEPGILEWDQAAEEDFAYHSVYGSESEIFDETATLIGYTVEPTYDVSGDPYGFYHVTTSDYSGNEGDAATIENPATSTPGDPVMATVFALHAARPNPFGAGTSIAFDLPVARDVRLSIFDALGQRVRVLIDDHRPAGRHLVAWDGRNEGNQRVGPGVYFIRIAAGALRAEERVVLLK